MRLTRLFTDLETIERNWELLYLELTLEFTWKLTANNEPIWKGTYDVQTRNYEN